MKEAGSKQGKEQQRQAVIEVGSNNRGKIEAGGEQGRVTVKFLSTRETFSICLDPKISI